MSLSEIIYQWRMKGLKKAFQGVRNYYEQHGLKRTFNKIYKKIIRHEPVIKMESGFCPCCDHHVKFISKHQWLRDYYLCSNCHSIPRERALMYVIEEVLPNYKNLTIHESSPGQRGASVKLRQNCSNYIASHYFPDSKLDYVDGYKNIDIQNQNFDDEMFDLVVTQDVFEHLPDPEKAIKEIYRTLKPGGYFISTIPLVNKFSPTEQWAVLENGKVKFLHEPEYHGNPINEDGSPVFFHYGYDIAHSFDEWTNMQTIMIKIEKPEYGIEAEYIEVIVSQKKL